MPNGRVQRIDEAAAMVYIVRRGRVFAAPLAEVESGARVPSARVTFDLVRHGGSETAERVRLTTGTRTNRRQRRFGDLTGARRPGAKTATIASRVHGVDVTTQPFRVASAWLEAMATSDFDGATSLYLPGAVMALPGPTPDDDSEIVAGRRDIRAGLERSPLAGVDPTSHELTGIDRLVRADGPDNTVYFEIDRGQIVEQWIDVVPDLDEAEDDAIPIEVAHRGSPPGEADGMARRMVEQLADHGGGRMRSARVTLAAATNPAVERPAMVEASLEFERSIVRAKAAAATFDEATSMVAERLRSTIEHQLDRDRLNHNPAAMPAPPGSWRHGNLTRAETPYYDRPTADREIVRHKSFAPDELTVDEAVWDMSVLAYDFFLFVELATGLDAMLEQSENGLVLHRLDPGSAPDGVAVPDEVALCRSAPPTMAVSEAIELLNGSGSARLLFRNAATGRGNVIYRRYDGHYGLITPPDHDLISEVDDWAVSPDG